MGRVTLPVPPPGPGGSDPSPPPFFRLPFDVSGGGPLTLVEGPFVHERTGEHCTVEAFRNSFLSGHTQLILKVQKLKEDLGRLRVRFCKLNEKRSFRRHRTESRCSDDYRGLKT